MLNFIGIGSAFNTVYGNTSAYRKSDSSIFMIDCGETTFHRILTSGNLENVEKAHVLITHFHPDHIGSLGSFIFYMYFKYQPFAPRVTVYSPEMGDLAKILDMMGVPTKYYIPRKLEGDMKRDLITIGANDERILVTPMKVIHDIVLKCYGYFLEFVDHPKGKRIYYSGDSKIIPEKVIDELNSGSLHLLFQDTSTHDYEDNVHLSLKKLNALIPEDVAIRGKVWCMHIDKDWDISKGHEMGFKTVGVNYIKHYPYTQHITKKNDDGHVPAIPAVMKTSRYETQE